MRNLFRLNTRSLLGLLAFGTLLAPEESLAFRHLAKCVHARPGTKLQEIERELTEIRAELQDLVPRLSNVTQRAQGCANAAANISPIGRQRDIDSVSRLAQPLNNELSALYQKLRGTQQKGNALQGPLQKLGYDECRGEIPTQVQKAKTDIDNLVKRFQTALVRCNTGNPTSNDTGQD